MKRPIRKEEFELVSHLMRLSGRNDLIASIPSSVIDLADGDMGSIKFQDNSNRVFGRELINTKYIDQDGVVVYISINLDDNGELLELDFWKTDFSKLVKYPDINQIAVE